MKKKAYLIPAAIITDVELQTLINASITHVEGDSGIGLADDDDEIPETADSRRRRRSVWDDEEEEEW